MKIVSFLALCPIIVKLVNIYPSIRLAAVRDGIEDYERLDEAAKVFGRELVTKAVLKITPSVIEFDRSGEKLLKIRRELADRMSR